jgi:hypothetical protein
MIWTARPDTTLAGRLIAAQDTLLAHVIVQVSSNTRPGNNRFLRFA